MTTLYIIAGQSVKITFGELAFINARFFASLRMTGSFWGSMGE